MNLKKIPQEQIKQLSMIELTYELLAANKQAIPFKDLVKELGKLLGLTQEEVRSRMSQFYTDLNIDGRFLAVGENRWGIRSWYPYDQVEEEVAPVPKAKKKRAKKATDEDELEVEGFDELDDEDYDDIDELDELDDIDDLDDDEEDEDEEVVLVKKEVAVDEEEEDDVEDFDDELLDEDYDLEDEEDDLEEKEDEDEKDQ
ncbi:DNA-directed RNA polymerase subunit delta [Bacillus sp. DJP31]|uniref:DNA-directed RNA polymerase subunit delta n=1 Tax=Bacillus sp. DJP31 TaxID=3409789 RepID=UPI003BB4ACDD